MIVLVCHLRLLTQVVLANVDKTLLRLLENTCLIASRSASSYYAYGQYAKPDQVWQAGAEDQMERVVPGSWSTHSRLRFCRWV